VSVAAFLAKRLGANHRLAYQARIRSRAKGSETRRGSKDSGRNASFTCS
jgi:hypothetical protein